MSLLRDAGNLQQPADILVQIPHGKNESFCNVVDGDVFKFSTVRQQGKKVNIYALIDGDGQQLSFISLR